ncbi:hypothetical protein [Spirillospora sp. NPDC047279]|uniref:alpha/beta hydrolase family protein n=1 Tax=Spirillospora sp. NPDC047279 TaxID=3155478 RepID=UPI0033C7CECE
MTRFTAVTAAVATGAALAGGSAAAAVQAAAPAAPAAPGTAPIVQGELVSAEYLRGMTAQGTRTWLAGDGFSAGSVRYGVDTYRLVYRTVDDRGRPTTASGLLVLPRNDARRLRTVSFTHGTSSYKPEAPSTDPEVWSQGPAVTYGSAGFAAVAPDYLGLGLGPGMHPWKDVPSETTAALDLLRAAKQFVPRTGRALDRQVMATGFSQGASPALGLARALQEGRDPWFRIRAVAPIAGGYDFRGAQIPTMIGDEGIPRRYRDELEKKVSVAYVAYLLTSWNRQHGLYAAPGEVFKERYAGRVEKFFDGSTPGQEMLQGLPGSLDELLTGKGFELLRKPGGSFARALTVDGEVCTAWTPRVPIRLYKISKDEQATTLNTDHCKVALSARGVDVPVVDLGDRTYGGSRHLGANLAGTAQAVRWFGGLR